MINPYKFLRAKAGYTQKQFCDEFGFAKQTLISIEAGVYEELSERMINAIFDATASRDVNMTRELETEYGVPAIATAYRTWRVTERANCDYRITDYVPTNLSVEVNGETFSPMHWFVKDTVGSVQGFAKALKVQTAILLSYITGKQKEMPAPLEHALTDAGYHHIDMLKKYQTEWIKNNA